MRKIAVRKILVLIAAMLLSCLTIAVLSNSTAQAADPQIGEPLKQGEILRGRFTQERSLQGFQAPLKSEGSFVVAQGKGLIWTVEKPYPTTTVITPNGLVQEARGNETLRLPASRVPFLTRLYDMLSGTMTGDWNAMKSQFSIETAGTAENWTLQLRPKSAGGASMPISEMRIQGGRYVNDVDMHRPSGDRDRLQFHDQTVGSGPLSEAETKLFEGALKK
ncbi:outer membrane lipoprotein carrier protein LolA [Dongia soli]|uniref:Outer membrane lipoprotein carrier protein LolA n=1 Tax=Dongia soli TaxID=600628 RepID=A0ABU5EG65_9PROT|nr:outer membrane lipoprotein carrier protein LolA [Dongia soli]MDY0885222.1 outer membrane lipoprotein carrier protein LolA [Dongia soli]